MFKFDPNKIYDMPPYFGGIEYDAESLRAIVNNAFQMSFIMTTDGSKLADFLPEGFQLLKPDLMIDFTQYREASWMNGGGYNLIRVQIPVRFNGKRDQFDGGFPLVIWENKTQPIIGGREQSGMPKLYADIEDVHVDKGTYFTNASYEGETFLRLKMTDPQPVNQHELQQIKTANTSQYAFGWRYIPKVGGPGAEISQPILYPASMDVKNAWTGKGTVEWIKRPEIYYNYIITALADLPVYSMAPVQVLQGSITMKPMEGRVLK